MDRTSGCGNHLHAVVDQTGSRIAELYSSNQSPLTFLSHDESFATSFQEARSLDQEHDCDGVPNLIDGGIDQPGLYYKDHRDQWAGTATKK